MAGDSRAGVVKAEHTVFVVCAAAVAVLVPFALMSGDAQAAAGSDVGAGPVASTAVTPKPTGRTARKPAPKQSPAVVEPESKSIAAVAAPAERIAPRALSALAAEPGPQAFAEVQAAVVDPAAPPIEPAAAPVTPPPVSVSPTPSGWYTPVAKYYFSARYGVAGSWSSGHHTGLDFVTRNGMPIRAATDGVVVAAGYAGAYGNLLQIKVAPKTQIWMAHLERFNVKPGAQVKAGEIVGWVGMTGNTTGPHCHFEVRIKDKPQNPEPFFWPDGDAVTRIRH